MAHAYPGTELYDFAKSNGFILNEGTQMVDAMGHQVAMIEYPGISRDYIMEMVHRFYDEYYFRPKAAFRVDLEGVCESRSAPALRGGQGLPQAARTAQQDGQGRFLYLKRWEYRVD
jgi:hypothetical protein